jgi:anthranilate phosphoribosyltransferase
VLVVHGDDGLDELTTTTTSTVVEVLSDGSVRRSVVDPVALGLPLVDPSALVGGDASVNAAVARSVFAGSPGPARDVVVLNAAAGLVAAGRVDDLEKGVAVAAASIDDGGASGALDRLVALSQSSSS